jgi:hypothetical protein
MNGGSKWFGIDDASMDAQKPVDFLIYFDDQIIGTAKSVKVGDTPSFDLDR